jgi:hypothetical protein
MRRLLGRSEYIVIWTIFVDVSTRQEYKLVEMIESPNESMPDSKEQLPVKRKLLFVRLKNILDLPLTATSG